MCYDHYLKAPRKTNQKKKYISFNGDDMDLLLVVENEDLNHDEAFKVLG